MVTAARHGIVFAHLGGELPAWAFASMAQASFFNSCPIFMVAEAAALKSAKLPAGVQGIAIEDVGVSDIHRAFRQVSTLDRSYRNGFWTYTTERFFVLERAMQQLGLGAMLHLENDVLLYADMDMLAPKLATLYPGVAATFDNDDRCIPGFIFVSRVGALSAFVHFIVAVMDHARTLPPEQNPIPTDMLLMAIWRRSRPAGDMDALPVLPPDYAAPLRSILGDEAGDPALYSRHFSELGMVFDAASIGQYLGGVDARNQPGPSRGFVNEGCLYDPRLLKPRMVVGDDGLKRPLIESASGRWPMANLHMHSKEMVDFLSRPL
jgi:hypothetical protein